MELAKIYSAEKGNNIIELFPAEKPAEHKLKKDGTPKLSGQSAACRNKKQGVSSEVYPFEIEDLRNILGWFLSHDNWLHYLITVIECNTARRIGDVLERTWKDFITEDLGFRDHISKFAEQKTGKFADVRINESVRNAIELYFAKTGEDIADHYNDPVGLQFTGNYKGTVISYSGYYKRLKKAAKECGVKYNVASHSARKFFGKLIITSNPSDPYALLQVQSILNHSDPNTTLRYVGITRDKIDRMIDSVGRDFESCVTNGENELRCNEPVVSLRREDLTSLLMMAYEMGLKNVGKDAADHANAAIELANMLETMKI